MGAATPRPQATVMGVVDTVPGSAAAGGGGDGGGAKGLVQTIATQSQTHAPMGCTGG